jgi:hypothetical protein
VTSGDAQESVARLFEELKRVRQDLATAQSQRDGLQQELANAREALTWAQGELASRAQVGLQNWPLGHPDDVESQRSERVRLETKIDAARKMAGRRGWRGLTVMG